MEMENNVVITYSDFAGEDASEDDNSSKKENIYGGAV